MTDAHTPGHDAHGHSDTHAGPSMLSNVLGIIGLIILAIIVIWGLFHLATLFGGGSSSTKTDTISVTAPANANAGEPLTISWKYTPKQSGAYAMVYQCKTGLQFTYPSGTTHAQIPCGVAYTLGAATSSATVLPLLAGTSTVSVPVTIIYIPSTASSSAAPIQGSVSIAIHPTSGSGTAGTPTQTTTTTSKPATTTTKPAAPIATGPSDLKVTLVSLTADAYGNGIAVFDIANVGGSTSASYSFQAQLPTAQPYTYTSPLQSPLAPGSHIENTLRFSQAVPGLFSVTATGDSSSANDSASQYLSTAYRAY